MEYREFGEKLLDTGAKYFKDNTSAWERYQKSLSGRTLDSSQVSDIQNEFLKFVQKEGPETIKKLMQNNADYYLSLFNTALEFNQQMAQALSSSSVEVTQVCESDGQETGEAKPAEKVCNIDLHFTAQKGKVQNEAFVIANNTIEDVQVSFEVSELICEDGKNKIPTPVSFKPDHFLLKKDAEQVVECRLKLTRVIKPGHQYIALARVVGIPDLYLRLIVSSD